jgi:PAS domain S-box-containing protein
MEVLLDQLLDTAASVLDADSASIQMIHPERGATGELKLLAHKGFSAEAAKRWEWVGTESLTPCGQALRTRQTIVIPDVRQCAFMAGSEDLQIFLEAGIHAGQTVPLMSRSGVLLGMISAYWRSPHDLSVRELRLLDSFAQLAADVIERAWTEDALLENQQRLASMYDIVKDIIFQLAVEPGGQFRFVSVNSAFLKVTGLKRDAVVGKKVHDVIPEPSLSIVLEKYRQAIREQTTVSWEETSEYPTGRLNGEVSITPVLDKTGTCTHLVGSVHDITERKRAETALRESEERFRNMADTAPVMIWVTGPDKLFTFVNRTWLEFTGRTIEQELGEGWAAGVHPDDRQRLWEAFCSAFESRRNFQLECRMRRADGVYRSVLCSGVPRFAPGGDFAGYIGSDIDVTDLQSEERFRQLAENINQVFWMFDLPTQQIIYVSPAFEEVWGFSPTAVYQNRACILQTVHPEDRDRVQATFANLRSGQVEASYRIIRADGAVRWIHDRRFLISDPEGKPYRVAGIVEDITAQRDLEEQLRQAQKMEALGRLAGGIAHDFNNLLTVICGYSRRLLDADRLIEQDRRKLEQILNAGNHASILTRQLLAFSRRQVRQPQVVNVNRLLRNLEALLRPLMGEQITIETELDPGLSCIEVDPHQIEQVLLNLAANARDAMPNGGQFSIRTIMTAAGDADHGLNTDGKLVQITITDTGCGMDARTRERAFEPFFTTKGVGKGTGLGLSTVYGIVRQNQGDVRISSELGRGTTLYIFFAASLGTESQEALPGKQFDQTRLSATILVVEDDNAVRTLVREALEQCGYTVLHAADGEEALRVVGQHSGEIQVLLTDVIMPVMNGPELVTRVRSIRPEIRVLYMSGYPDEVLALHGIAHPEMAFVQKPFTSPELAAKVDRVLSA